MTTLDQLRVSIDFLRHTVDEDTMIHVPLHLSRVLDAAEQLVLLNEGAEKKQAWVYKGKRPFTAILVDEPGTYIVKKVEE